MLFLTVFLIIRNKKKTQQSSLYLKIRKDFKYSSFSDNSQKKQPSTSYSSGNINFFLLKYVFLHFLCFYICSILHPLFINFVSTTLFVASRLYQANSPSLSKTQFLPLQPCFLSSWSSSSFNFFGLKVLFWIYKYTMTNKTSKVKQHL